MLGLAQKSYCTQDDKCRKVDSRGNPVYVNKLLLTITSTGITKFPDQRNYFHITILCMHFAWANIFKDKAVDVILFAIDKTFYRMTYLEMDVF